MAELDLELNLLSYRPIDYEHDIGFEAWGTLSHLLFESNLPLTLGPAVWVSPNNADVKAWHPVISGISPCRIRRPPTKLPESPKPTCPPHRIRRYCLGGPPPGGPPPQP